jgi:HD-GYP domain-containing protein (c-di-GMP phosphodiesterase class II)
MTTESEDDLLHWILNDAVSVLGAQRGAIVLADAPDGSLRLRAFASRDGEAPGRFPFNKKLAERVFNRGESIVCSVRDDAKLTGEVGSSDGAMASALCMLLRTPRKRLGVLHLDRSHSQKAFNENDLQRADTLAAHVSGGIECASLLQRQRDLFLKTITLLAQSVELRDAYTGAHCARVTNYSLLLAQKLNLPPKEIDLIRIGATLHDLGMTGIGDEILRKPGKLTDAEYEIMKTHSAKGAEIISTVPDLQPILPIVRSHHERWDGRGYPDKLKGDAIPQLARIVAVADAFDAMTSNAPYHPDQKGCPPKAAFEEIRQIAGTQFDPECVSAFLELQTKIEEMMNRAAAPGSA